MRRIDKIRGLVVVMLSAPLIAALGVVSGQPAAANVSGLPGNVLHGPSGSMQSPGSGTVVADSADPPGGGKQS